MLRFLLLSKKIPFAACSNFSGPTLRPYVPLSLNAQPALPTYASVGASGVSATLLGQFSAAIDGAGGFTPNVLDQVSHNGVSSMYGKSLTTQLTRRAKAGVKFGGVPDFVPLG